MLSSAIAALTFSVEFAKLATLLREYLKEKHLDTAFEHYNPQQLDECLAHFFMNVRKSVSLYHLDDGFWSVRLLFSLCTLIRF
jgi:hypothetical protein